MKPTEIRSLNQVEQMHKIEDVEGEMLNLRFQSRTGKLDNPTRMRLLRRDVARLKTIVRETALQQEKTIVPNAGSLSGAISLKEGHKK